jgi:hypothetical protein
LMRLDEEIAPASHRGSPHGDNSNIYMIKQTRGEKLAYILSIPDGGGDVVGD